MLAVFGEQGAGRAGHVYDGSLEVVKMVDVLILKDALVVSAWLIATEIAVWIDMCVILAELGS